LTARETRDEHIRPLTSSKPTGAASRAVPERPYDPFSEPLLSDPYPFFEAVRRDAPVFYAEVVDHWVVARYEDVKAVLLDPESYSAANTIAPIYELTERARTILRDGAWNQRPALGNNDPPEHARFRRNVHRAFTPRRVAVLEPFIREFVESALDRVAARGRCDLMAELLYDLPAFVILELLGIPHDGVALVREAAANRVVFVWGRPTPEEQERLAEAMVRFWGYLRGIVDERVAEPRDDLTSELVRVRAGDDEIFTLDEIASVLFAFLTAGHETTSSLLGNAVRRLLEDRPAWEAIRSDRSRIPNAVEEALRHDSSVVAWRRRTLRAVELRGVAIPEGAQVLLLLGSANHDEEVFDDAERFDIQRENAGAHLSFGHGIHYCLGAPLARLEAATALEILARRLPTLRLVPDTELRFIANTSFRGPLELRVEWDPGSRS
jgi:cytochrome P450